MVQSLMETLLEDCPSLLDAADVHNMMDKERCKKVLGLRIGNHPLLRLQKDGREVGGRARYYEKIYGGKFYLCSQWWKAYHYENARSLLRLVTELTERRVEHPELRELEKHLEALHDYIG